MKTIISGRVKAASVACAALVVFGAFGADRTWTGNVGDGVWSTAGNWSDNSVPSGTGDNALFNSSGGTITVAVNDTRTIKEIRNHGTADVVINIAQDQRLNVSNSGGAGIQAFNGDLTINGPGKLGLSTAGGINHLDNGADLGRTLAIYAEIIRDNGNLDTGFEAWRGTPPGGTIILGYLDNAFTLDVQVGGNHEAFIVAKLADKGQPSAIGAGNNIVSGAASNVRYTGPAVSTDRGFLLNGGGGIEQAGSGILTWAGPIYNYNNNPNTLRLFGDVSAPEARITGNIYNSQNVLSLTKYGTGTWVLSGNNSFTGPVAINAGTLVLDSTNAVSSAASITIAGGVTLTVNRSVADDFIASFPAISASIGSVTLNIAQAPTCSEVTFRGLVAADIAINAPGAGTPANRIFFTGLASGPVGTWLTLNGGPAQYDLVDGLSPLTLTPAGIKTRGDTLPDGNTIKAVIDTVGTPNDPPIALLNDPTELFALVMDVAGDDATVDTKGKALLVGELAIESGADALTIGVDPQDGILLPLGFAPPAAVPDISEIEALAPIIWYDPSDFSTVTTNETGGVSNLVNKGTLSATHDAVVRGGHTAPAYVTGTDSYTLLPMLRNTVVNQGLQSAVNTGISGNANRTLVSVQARAGEAIVSIGAGSSNNAFENYLTTGATRFGGYSADLDLPVTPPGTPVVMVFVSGVDGNPNVYQGFANGVPTRTTLTNNSFNTTDTPIHLGHRSGAGTYTGQIGEVLLFNRTLSDTERKTLEVYLMAKWNTSSPASEASQNGIISLRNDSAANLTVNAALATPPDSVISLVKAGTGEAVLAGGVNLSGPVVLAGGTLTLDTPDNLLNALYGVISGPAKLAKDGPGSLFLPPASANLYLGGTDIRDGTVRVGNSRSLGDGPVTIFDGGTLDIGSGTAAESMTITNRIFVEGMGKDGLGAIVNNGPYSQRNMFQNSVIQLTGDAAIGGATAPRWDIAGMGMTLDLNEYTLVKLGVTDFRISPANVINAPEGVAFDIKAGTLGIESQTVLAPNDAKREIHIAADGARFGMYAASIHQNWKIVPADGAEIWAYGGNESTNLNVLTSDITLPPGTVHLTSSGNFNTIFTGALSGSGGLYVRMGGLRSMRLLANPNNTFTGPVVVNSAVLGLRTPGSLPDRAKLTQEGSGAVRVFMGGADEWTSADVDALVTEPHLFTTADRRFQIQVIAGNTGTLTHNIGSASAPFPANFDINGGGTLVVNADVTMGTEARLNNGTLILENDAVWHGGNSLMYLQDYALNDGTPSLSTLIVRDNAKFIFNDPGYNNGANARALRVTQNAGRGVVELKDNAFIQSNITLGGFNSGDLGTGNFGAVYQSGNSEWMSFGGGGNDARIGRYGYGYYNLAGGKLTMKGWSHLGGINNTTSVGILHQTGGLIEFTGKRSARADQYVAGDSYDGCFGVSRGGTGNLHLEGGIFRSWGELLILEGNDGGSGSENGGTAIMTVAGDADVWIDRQIQIGNRNNGLAVLNLNGGKLTTTYIQRMNRDGHTSVNFSGGTLCVSNNAGNSALFALQNSATDQLGLYVHGGGATIELGAGVTRTLDFPLERPEGRPLVSIPVTAGGSGYIAPPFVRLIGGDGTNATALAHINRSTGALTHIEITNPGSGYTSAPAVTLVGGGGSGVTLGAAQMGSSHPVDGGLTKTGDGTLYLDAANTYLGPTRVEGGILVLRHPQAIQPLSEIIIGDGTLDLGGHTFTTPSVTITGSGAIINGNVITTSAVKTGPGTATWDVGIEFASMVLEEPIPGLWEGRIGPASPYWRLDLPNPKDSIQLTTRAGNVPYGANNTAPRAEFWNGNNNLWIYTGYVWNRTDRDVTWTWRASFDDNTSLKIDGIQLINQTGNNVVVKNYTLTPGPHPIEIRFGDGTGSVGPYQSNPSGMAYDPTGNNTGVAGDHIILEDDGTGYLLTATLGKSLDPQYSTIQVLEGTLRLARPGLWEGHRQVPGGTPSGYWDLTFPNPKESIQFTTRAGNIPTGNNTTGHADRNFFWAGNSNMWIYTGYVWNRTGTDKTWTFRGVFDDNVSVVLNDVLLFNQNGNNVGYANPVLKPGANPIEIRFGDGTGNVGPYSGVSGLLVDRQGNDFRTTDATELLAYYEILADLGNGLLLTVDNDPDLLDGVTINVSDGATLDLGGGSHNGLTVTGEGSVINGTPGSGSGTILSPAGDYRTGTLNVDGFNALNGLTYRVTIHDPVTPPFVADTTPGLWSSGRLPGWSTTTPNPKVSIVQTPEAGNILYGNNTNPNDPAGAFETGLIRSNFWASGNCMYIYTGYLWNHSDTDVTWTWRLSFDDHTFLKIDDWELYVPLTVTVNNVGGVVYVDTTLTPGPHFFEVRFGEIGGNVGPAGGAISGLLYDPLGRGLSSSLGNFIILENPTDGSPPLLTTSADVDLPGTILNDVINFTGLTDLTGLTIQASDLPTKAPPGDTYVIATSDKGFIGVPKVTGFTDGRPWQTRRNGNELWLTTRGPTLLILR